MRWSTSASSIRDRAIIQVANVFEATSQLAQTTLRSVLGQHELDEMLSEREKLNLDIQRILDQATDAWGIKVSNVEIKHVDLDETMIRAIAKQAEAERTRRAKVIHAEGEKQAAAMLVEAAHAAADPRAMQLRYLQTLADISSERDVHDRFSAAARSDRPASRAGPGVIAHSQLRSPQETLDESLWTTDIESATLPEQRLSARALHPQK